MDQNEAIVTQNLTAAPLATFLALDFFISRGATTVAAEIQRLLGKDAYKVYSFPLPQAALRLAMFDLKQHFTRNLHRSEGTSPEVMTAVAHMAATQPEEVVSKPTFQNMLVEILACRFLRFFLAEPYRYDAFVSEYRSVFKNSGQEVPELIHYLNRDSLTRIRNEFHPLYQHGDQTDPKFISNLRKRHFKSAAVAVADTMDHLLATLGTSEFYEMSISRQREFDTVALDDGYETDTSSSSNGDRRRIVSPSHSSQKAKPKFHSASRPSAPSSSRRHTPHQSRTARHPGSLTKTMITTPLSRSNAKSSNGSVSKRIVPAHGYSSDSSSVSYSHSHEYQTQHPAESSSSEGEPKQTRNRRSSAAQAPKPSSVTYKRSKQARGHSSPEESSSDGGTRAPASKRRSGRQTTDSRPSTAKNSATQHSSSNQHGASSTTRRGAPESADFMTRLDFTESQPPTSWAGAEPGHNDYEPEFITPAFTAETTAALLNGTYNPEPPAAPSSTVLPRHSNVRNAESMLAKYGDTTGLLGPKRTENGFSSAAAVVPSANASSHMDVDTPTNVNAMSSMRPSETTGITAGAPISRNRSGKRPAGALVTTISDDEAKITAVAPPTKRPAPGFANEGRGVKRSAPTAAATMQARPLTFNQMRTAFSPERVPPEDVLDDSDGESSRTSRPHGSNPTTDPAAPGKVAGGFTVNIPGEPETPRMDGRAEPTSPLPERLLSPLRLPTHGVPFTLEESNFLLECYAKYGRDWQSIKLAGQSRGLFLGRNGTSLKDRIRTLSKHTTLVSGRELMPEHFILNKPPPPPRAPANSSAPKRPTATVPAKTTTAKVTTPTTIANATSQDPTKKSDNLTTVSSAPATSVSTTVSATKKTSAHAIATKPAEVLDAGEETDVESDQDPVPSSTVSEPVKRSSKPTSASTTTSAKKAGRGTKAKKSAKQTAKVTKPFHLSQFIDNSDDDSDEAPILEKEEDAYAPESDETAEEIRPASKRTAPVSRRPRGKPVSASQPISSSSMYKRYPKRG